MECWRLGGLALPINYDTQLVSVCFERRDSGELPTFLLHPFLPASLIFAYSLYKRPYSSCFLS